MGLPALLRRSIEQHREGVNINLPERDPDRPSPRQVCVASADALNEVRHARQESLETVVCRERMDRPYKDCRRDAISRCARHLWPSHRLGVRKSALPFSIEDASLDSTISIAPPIVIGVQFTCWCLSEIGHRLRWRPQPMEGKETRTLSAQL